MEIVKCLRRDPTILVFDEPTSVLTPAESEQLFSVLRRVVAEEGRTVALVSHKLDEVLQATDVISIMRQGRVVEHLPAADADARTLARAMVGREVSLRAEAAAFGLAEAVQGTAAGVVSAVAAEPVPALRIRARVRAGARTAHPCWSHSTSRSAPARSSAWPASRATASGSWPTCCRR